MFTAMRPLAGPVGASIFLVWGVPVRTTLGWALNRYTLIHTPRGSISAFLGTWSMAWSPSWGRLAACSFPERPSGTGGGRCTHIVAINAFPSPGLLSSLQNLNGGLRLHLLLLIIVPTKTPRFRKSGAVGRVFQSLDRARVGEVAGKEAGKFRVGEVTGKEAGKFRVGEVAGKEAGKFRVGEVTGKEAGKFRRLHGQAVIAE